MTETIDIVTTATIRPDIIDITYRSFYEKLFKNNFNYRLIINIDPIGDKRFKSQDVLSIAKRYFNDIVYNMPKEPNFTKAVKWCWNNVKAKYVFHLEDDWILNEFVDISKLISILDNYDNVAMIRLYKGSLDHNMKPLNSSFIKKEDYDFVKLIDKRCCLNPGLFRGSYNKEASDLMVDNFNPESQLCYRFSGIDAIDNFIEKWEYFVYGHPRAVVSDNGRRWRKKMNINRKPDFLQWEML